MSALPRERVLALMKSMLDREGVASDSLSPTTDLTSIGFRSLDFSELALRVEKESGAAFDFDAVGLRTIETVGDVLDYLEALADA